MTYRVEKSNQVERFLDASEKRGFLRIRTEIDALSFEPFPRGHIKLRGYTNLYRLRVGAFRIIYSVNHEKKLIVLVYIDDRKNAYKKL